MNPFSDQLVLWVINVLIHSTVLTAILLCVARLFRKRAAMRYWILCCGLLLVLASPAVSALVQSRGSGWLALVLPNETAPVASVAVTEQPTPANDSPMQSLPAPQVNESITPSVLDANRMEELANAPIASKPMMAADVPVNPSAATPAVKDARSPMQWLAIIVTIATAVWAVGAMLLLMRMTIGWSRLAGILRRAEPITDPDYVAAFTKACALAGCPDECKPRLVASDEISGPLAAGIFAGSVVLPKRLIAESSPAELAEVLVHEVAHVVRRDPIVVLIQNLVAAIYWPHPLVRKLNRELAKAREEVCDNFVLRATEAPIYSRTLLSLAQLVQRPETIPGSVGFFASRWRLEQRVAGLLDESRDTQTILSRRGWAFVLASTVGLLAAICVGTVTIAKAQVTPQPLTEEPIKLVQTPFQYSGQVIDPDGRPIAGAKIYRGSMLGKAANDEQPAMPVATSDNNGDFDFTVPASKKVELYGDRVLRFGTVVAIRDGFAPAVTNIHDNKPGDPLQLRLVANDEPITGRILDLQGQPISGVKVSFNSLEVPTLNSLGVIAWRKMLNDRPDGMTVQRKFFSFTMLPSFFQKRNVETDAEGRFEMPSFGSDRIVAMLIESPTIQTQEIRVVTGTPIEPISVPWYANAPALGTLHYVPNNFDFVAGPTRPITGVLSDLETGKPLSGFQISGGTVGNPMNEIAATTDDEGRFRLTGVPASGKQTLTVLPPDDRPYISVERQVEIAPGEDPLEIDLKAPRGVWVEGAVVNQQTGEAAGANLSYFVFEKNQAYRQLGKNGLGLRRDMSSASTNDDGAFRTVVLPGSGVIAARGFREDYMMGVGDKLIVEGRQSDGDSFLRTAPYLCSTSNYHTVVQVNPTDVDDHVTITIGLDPGLTAEGRLVDSEGKPVAGASIRGTRPMSYWRESDTANFKAIGFTKGRSRQLLFWHEDRNLAGQTVISPGTRNEMIRLQPAGVITARLLDESGVPIRDTPIVSYNHGINEESDVEHDFVSVPQTLDIRTDDEGRFRVPSLIPGLTYDFGFENEPNHFPVLCIKGVTLKPGETRELGDCKPLPGPHDMETASQKKEGETLSGQVVDPSGKPITGAKIWLAVASHRYVGQANRSNRQGLLRELGTADAQGRFECVLDEATTDVIRKRIQPTQTLVLATASGHGLDWMPLDAFEDDPTSSDERDTLETRVDKALGDGRFASRTLKLRPETRGVRGRLVDLEGNRLPNVKVSVESLRQPDVARLLKAFEMSLKREVNEALSATSVGGLARNELQKLIPSVTTDANGEFELRGIGDDQLATLVFDDDRVQANPLNVLGRNIKAVSLPHIKWNPNGAKDVFVGRDFTHAIGPSVPVEGVVTDDDNGQPVAGALVYVERLFKEGSANDSQLRLDTDHMRSVTDNQGRFRITGIPPGEEHVLECIPPKSEPYLMVSKNVSLSLEDGDAKRIDFQVKRGIWIEGRVTDKKSGEPLSATVDYIALKKNPHSLEKLGLGRAWTEQRYGTDSDGRYRVLGLPGPGVLLVTSQVPGYPLASGAETIDGYDASDRTIPTTPFPLQLNFSGSNWHLLKQIDPASNQNSEASSFACDLELDAGLSIPGRVVGPGGEKISDLHVLGQTAGYKWWRPRHDDKVLLTDRFTVNGYDGTGPRQLFFKTKDESLVGQYRVEGDAPDEIVVTLEPSVRVTGRLIDSATELPAPGYFISCKECSLNEKDPPVEFMIHWCHTDDEGRFEIKGLMAGLTYKMRTANESNNRNKANDFTIELTQAKPGETMEIGDVPHPKNDGDSQN